MGFFYLLVVMMHGMETVVGMYLGLLIIVGILMSFYAWFRETSIAINEQLNNNIERMHYANYPPVLSLDFINSSYVKLSIYPYTPLYVSEVVVKEISEKLIYHEILERMVSTIYEVEIPISQQPVSIAVLSRSGVVFYYIPRLDPALSTAPDYIRSKIYVDKELIDYLALKKINGSSLGTWILLWDIGYKLYIGKPNATVDSLLLVNGPVICDYNIYALNTGSCNAIGIDNSPRNFLTYNRGMRSTISNASLYFHNGSALIIIPDGALSSYYIQVYRVIRVSRESSVTFKVNMAFRGGINTTINDTNRVMNFSIIPVVYVYEAKYNLVAPVTIYQIGDVNSPWYKRILLESTYVNATARGTTPIQWINRTYIVEVDLVNMALREAYVVVGLEIVTSANTQSPPWIAVLVDVFQ